MLTMGMIGSIVDSDAIIAGQSSVLGRELPVDTSRKQISWATERDSMPLIRQVMLP